GGALRRQTGGPSGTTFRRQVLSTLRPVPVLALAADLVYGPYTDGPRSRWEAMFLPQALHDGLAELSIEEGGARRTLVAAERVWRDEEYAPPGPLPDPVLIAAALAVLLLFAAALLRRRGPVAAAGALLFGGAALLA